MEQQRNETLQSNNGLLKKENGQLIEQNAELVQEVDYCRVLIESQNQKYDDLRSEF